MKTKKLTIGVLHMFLVVEESASAKIIFEKMDLNKINTLLEHNPNDANDEIKSQLRVIRSERGYYEMINSNHEKSKSIFDGINRFITRLLIQNK